MRSKNAVGGGSCAVDYTLAGPQGGLEAAKVISVGDVLASVLPVYLLLVAGVGLRRAGVLRREHDDGIMRVVYVVMLPAFMLDKILGSDVLRSGMVVFSAVIMGFAMMVMGLLIGLAVGRLIGLERGSGIRTFGLTAGYQNFGFTAVPVVEILWSTGALAVLFVHNIGCEIAMWSVGVMVMSASSGMQWKRLLNGPLIAVLSGLLLVALGLDHHVTGAPRTALSMIGIGTVPLALVLVGCNVSDMFGAERPTAKIIFGSALVRLALAPFGILAAAKFLPLATELKQVLVVQAAMPAAVTPIILARLYGGRSAVAAQVVVFTTALSLFTLPWIISLGCRWVGLNPVLP
jgi:predicted permease